LKVSFAGRAACTALHCTSCSIQLCLRTLRSIAWGVLGRAVRPAGDCTGAAARGGGVQGGLTESRRPQRGPHHSIVATRVETDRPCDTAAPSLEVIKRATPRSGQCPLGTAASLSGERLGRSAVRIQVLSPLKWAGTRSGSPPSVGPRSPARQPMTAPQDPPHPTFLPPSPPPGPPQAAPQRWGQPDPEGLPPHGAS
jgi:hypothetical protein